MRHWLSGTPPRAEPLLLAWEEGGALLGWAHAGRSWWHADPAVGILAISVDPSRRGEGIGTALAEAADDHLARLGVRTTRAGSLDEPAARALASSRGFTEIAAATVSAVDPRAVEPLPVPADVELVPLAALDDPEPVYELDLDVSKDIPNEDFDAIELEDWKAQFWKSPLIDDEASLVAPVDGELAGITMIRVDRPSGRATRSSRRSRSPASCCRRGRRASPRSARASPRRRRRHSSAFVLARELLYRGRGSSGGVALRSRREGVWS